MEIKNIRWTVPNILSTYRLLSAPVILVLIFTGYETVFVVLFVINQLTDILDGYIARRYKLETPEGVLLDSWADIGSYVIAFAAVFRFHTEIIAAPYGYWLLAYAISYTLPMLISLLKFGRLAAGLHLYSSKIKGYMQGSFLVILFIFGLIPWLFYIVIAYGMLTELECACINLLSKAPVQNAKGLYWVIKEQRL